MKNLRQIIIEHAGEDCADNQFISDLGYDDETLNDIPVLIGYYREYDTFSEIYEVGPGMWHICSISGQFYSEDNPREADDFICVERS